MNKAIDEILQKKMDRKDFLKHMAMGVAVITGTAGVVKLLKPQNKSASQQASAAYAYGASTYGGRPVARKS